MDIPKNSIGFDFYTSLLARGADFIFVLVGGVLTFSLRFGHLNIPIEYQSVILLGSMLVFLACSSSGAYVSWRGKSRAGLYGRLVLAWGVGFLTLLGLLVFAKQGELFSRQWLGLWVVVTLAAALLFRIGVYSILGFVRAKGWNHKKVLIVGNAPSSKRVIDQLMSNDWVGLDVIGILPYTRRCSQEGHAKVPCISEFGKLDVYVKDNNVQELWICLPLSEGDRIQELLYELRHSTVDIRYAPDMSDFRLLNHRVSEIAGLYTLDLSCSPLSGFNRILKKAEDFVLAMVIIVSIAPLLMMIGLAVKLTSRGPVLFKQLRHGIDGKPIKVYKFRTMRVHQEGGGEVTQAYKDDPRVTRLGRFLRRTSLDELPQFYNVLQGRMSVVGPRPHAMAHNEQYKDVIESYMKRHKVKPGITGWAQVNGLRGETDTVDKMKRRVEHDLFYIENWSLALDLKIVFLTLLNGFVHKNAY